MTSDKQTKKRFIAGAVCPKCHLMDKTVVYSVGGQQVTECVSCHFKQHAVDQKKKSKPSKKVIWINKS